MTDSHFANPQRFTNANPQQAEFKWGHRILIDYKDKDGHKLQGTLADSGRLSAGPEAADARVLLREAFTELRISTRSRATRSGPAYVDYVSNGYLVLLPDIYLPHRTDAYRSSELGRGRGEARGRSRLRRSEARRVCTAAASAARAARTSRRSRRCSRRSRFARQRSISSRTSISSGRRAARTSIATTPTGRVASATNPYDNLALFLDQSAVFHAKDDEYAAAHLPGHERRLDRVAAGRGVLQRASLPQEAGDLPVVRGRRRTASRATTISTTSRCA